MQGVGSQRELQAKSAAFRRVQTGAKPAKPCKRAVAQACVVSDQDAARTARQAKRLKAERTDPIQVDDRQQEASQAAAWQSNSERATRSKALAKLKADMALKMAIAEQKFIDEGLAACDLQVAMEKQKAMLQQELERDLAARMAVFHSKRGRQAALADAPEVILFH